MLVLAAAASGPETRTAAWDAASVLKIASGVFLLLFGLYELLQRADDRDVNRRGRAFFAKVGLGTALAAVGAWGVASAVGVWELGAIIAAVFLQVALEGRRTASSTALLFFYLIQIVSTLWTLVTNRLTSHLPVLLRLTLHLVLALAIFSLEVRGPEPWTTSGKDGYSLLPEDSGIHIRKRVSPLVRANVFSKAYFGWLSPLLRLGQAKVLTREDLYALPPYLEPEDQAARLAAAWEKEVKRTSSSLLRAIARSFGFRFSLLVFVVVANVLLGLVQPQLLRHLLLFITSYSKEGGDASPGYTIAILMFAVSVLQTVLTNAYGFQIIQTTLKIEGAISALVYDKCARLASADSGSETGTVLSVASSDPAEIAGNLTRMLSPVRVTLQLVLSFASLYQLLGIWVLPGVIVLVLTSPAAKLIARITSTAVEKQLEARDKRTRLMNDILAAMRTVKLYSWETPLAAKLSKIRNDEELLQLSRQGLWTSIESGFGNLAPFLVGFASFSSFAAFSGRDLTADIAFPSLALFELLAGPIQMIVPLIRFFSYIGVSLKRVENLISAREVSRDGVERLPATAGGLNAVELCDCSFGWVVGGSSHLQDIQLTVKRGEFLAVSGRVGAGKTTLLAGILGDALKLSGSAKVYGSIAYADQHPYIIGASVRDNVVFGRELDEAWYAAVLDASALVPDLASFPNGDETIVGERGVTLSGGQRARISLARAAYSKADVILLDDTLSAVDAHVATHILEKLLGPTGLLRDTTRILSTHLPRAWEAADRIVLIQEGTLLEKSPEEVKQLVSDEPKEEGREIDSYATEIKPEADGGADVDIVAPTGLVDATGAVSRSVFSTYLNWCTPLGHWTEAAGTTARSLAFWLGGYITLGFCASVMIVVGSYFALSIAGVRSARTAFDQAFAAVVKSPLYFFDTTPIGAIQNRFLGDIGKIEITLAETVQYTLLEASSIFASLIVISASAPLLLILVAPLALLYRRIQRQYLATSQEVNRIAASQRGPVLSSFQETLTGGPTIRAFGQEKHFRHRFFLALTRSQEASFINDVMNHWLWLRLMLMGSCVILVTTVLITLAVSSPRMAGLTPSQAGLMISYALSTSMDLASVVHSATKVETSLIAVERARALTLLPPEPTSEGAVGSHGSAGSKWPYSGAIEFSHVSAKYSKDGNLVLRDVTFKVKSGQRIGVVGRTGAGKSTLSLALFRAIEIESGSISIDGVNIKSVGSRTLRSRLTILPQEAQFFQASLRLNLDPTETATDIQLWDALEKVGMKGHVEAMDGGLDAMVTEHASSFSSGQRQLIGIARALLRNSKILLVDEATSSIDIESDTKIQAVIRKAFPRATIIIIAHRIETVLDCDKILVMDGGQCVEFDTPAALLARKGGKFAALVKQSRAGAAK